MNSSDYLLTSKDQITLLAKESGVISWHNLVSFVTKLPYGRNSNRHDLSLVLKEKKGSCSSKHALLKKLADLNSIPDVKLILGMYKMNAINTPGIGNDLVKNSIDYIPEAHCYLKINDKYFDFTSTSSNFSRIEKDVLEEIEIQPNQIIDFKVDYHKNFIKKWLADSKSSFSFETIWKIREACIRNLTH